MSKIIELAPQCFVCREFSYKANGEELYRCRVNCMQTNDIYDMWDNCPYLWKKYLVNESEEDMELKVFKEKTISELKKYYNTALEYRTPIKELNVGDDIGYWNGVKQTIEKICKELEIDLNE